MKKILMMTAGLFHPPLPARLALRRALVGLDGFEFHAVGSLEHLPADLDSYDAIVIYAHHQKLSETALKKLDGFVSGGGGLLGVHSATASYKTVPHYFEIIGGQFTGHGKVEKFSVEPLGRIDVFQDIPAFDVVDELYYHETQPGVEVHFVSRQNGEDVPVVWTYLYDEGRVCYAVPGHRTATMKLAAYQKLLQQGLRWVARA